MKSSLALVAFMASGLSSAAAIPGSTNTTNTTNSSTMMAPASEPRSMQHNRTTPAGWKLHEKFDMITIHHHNKTNYSTAVMPVKHVEHGEFPCNPTRPLDVC